MVVNDPFTQGIYINQFKLVRLLGRGGVGAVYLGENESKDQVAIKILRAAENSNPDIVSRFHREGLLLQKLQHPSIIKVLDFGFQPGVGCFLIMEYLEGFDLKTQLKQFGTLSPYETAKLGIQILSALSLVHRSGVIHRDLKPSNIYLTETGENLEAKLLDFGVAKLLDMQNDESILQTRRGLILGSPGYMAPEQAAGSRKIDASADIYSLGVILFECLAGRRPFLGSSYLELFVFQKTKPAPPLSRFVPKVSKPLAKIILNCLEKESKKRGFDTTLLQKKLESLLPVLSQKRLEIKEIFSLSPKEGSASDLFLEVVDDDTKHDDTKELYERFSETYPELFPEPLTDEEKFPQEGVQYRRIVIAWVISAILFSSLILYLVFFSTLASE